MNGNLRKLHIAICFLCFSIPTYAKQAAALGSAKTKIEIIQVHSPALESNKLDDPADQKVAIYLPPSYASSPSKRFPTIYLLHGYLGSSRQWGSLQNAMDTLMGTGSIAEMIVVAPNANNAYGGSFYTNSATTGNWEDYIVRDLVHYIDSHYRTIAAWSSRGIAGHSMGGYGSIMLAMKHPDVFGAFYAMSPCCLGMMAGLTSANPAWHAVLKINSKNEATKPLGPGENFFVHAFVALSAAFSPNLNHQSLLVDFPYREEGGQLVPNEPAMSEWHEKFPLDLAEKYKSNLLQLHGISIDYGMSDESAHIPITSRLFAAKLTEIGIPNTLSAYKGKHMDHMGERLETDVLPFFSRILEQDKN